MLKQSLACLLIAAASAPSHADNCDPIRDQIEAKYKAGGISNFSVKVVDAAAVGTAKVVGTCSMGSKRIVFIPGATTGAAPAAPAAPAKAAEPPIVTECKDGSVSHTGSCKK